MRVNIPEVRVFLVVLLIADDSVLVELPTVLDLVSVFSLEFVIVGAASVVVVSSGDPLIASKAQC